ncbi:MAG: hypothetical protein JXA42_24360 [Anaerolineales bacterium]|nr:hypothetical protein [Anaerolineales bacterium]
MPLVMRISLVFFSGMGLLLSLLVSCSTRATSQPATPTPFPVVTDVSLPADVYFLRDGQIWRLARDGKNQQQITSESSPVVSMDVSTVHGALVYVANNDLILIEGPGEDRQVLLSGPALPPVESELAALNDRAYITGRIATPVWLSDGSWIAFIQNGLNVISAADGKIQVLHSNDSIPEEGETTHRLVITTVFSWSPDKKHLLVEVYYYPLVSIYTQKFALKTISGYLSGLGDCYGCTFAWSPDSQAVYLGNPLQGGSDSLRRCDVAIAQCSLIGLDEPARKAYFYAYPHIMSQEDVYVFMASSPDPMELPELFKLYRMGSKGYGTTTLRADQYAIRDALWANDGSGVLIVTAALSEGIPADTLVWLPAGGGPAGVLPVSGAAELHWGVGE